MTEKVINFSEERAARRPNELPHMLQETINLCSDDQAVGPEIVFHQDPKKQRMLKYIKDLAGRMLKASNKNSGVVGSVVMGEFNQLEPDEQQEVINVLSKYKET